jgi:GNAT superfamily N-acetyltransferase
MLQRNIHLSPMMIHCIRTLTTAELPKYRDHLLRLDAEDRRLRFGFPISDQTIRDHVRGIDTKADRILVQVDDHLKVIAAVHIAAGDPGTVEFAFSVDRQWRGRGLGRQLFEQAILWARNRGLRDAFIYYLVDNRAMRHLARQAGMAGHNEAGEIEGRLRLDPPTTLSYLRELAAERWGMYDYSLKASRLGCRPLQVQPAI